MLEIKNVNNIVVASFTEEKRFNAVISQDVKNHLNGVLEKNDKLIFDLGGITFIDSSGFGAMLSVYKHAKKNNCNFKLCNISEEVFELVKLMQLHNVFDIHTSLAECINSFAFTK
jgi:anti-sigma B factor antagonist